MMILTPDSLILPPPPGTPLDPRRDPRNLLRCGMGRVDCGSVFHLLEATDEGEWMMTPCGHQLHEFSCRAVRPHQVADSAQPDDLTRWEALVAAGIPRRTDACLAELANGGLLVDATPTSLTGAAFYALRLARGADYAVAWTRRLIECEQASRAAQPITGDGAPCAGCGQAVSAVSARWSSTTRGRVLCHTCSRAAYPAFESTETGR